MDWDPAILNSFGCRNHCLLQKFLSQSQQIAWLLLPCAVFEQDNEIHPCADYISRGMKCPDAVHVGMPRDDPKCSGGSQCRDVVPLRTLLRAVRNLAPPGYGRQSLRPVSRLARRALIALTSLLKQ